MLNRLPKLNVDKLVKILVVNILKRDMVTAIIAERERQGETGLECL